MHHLLFYHNRKYLGYTHSEKIPKNNETIEIDNKKYKVEYVIPRKDHIIISIIPV